MQAQRLRHLRADAPHRVERADRVLEDERDPAAADLREPRRRGVAGCPAPSRTTAPATVRPRRQQAERREPGHRFARTGFAHQAERLAARHLEIDAVQHRGIAEPHPHPADADDGASPPRQLQLRARKSMSKAGDAFQPMLRSLPVKVAFWCSTV